MLIVAMSLTLTSMIMAVPHRYNQPLDREISLANLLDEKKQFSRADLDYYINIFTDYKDYVPKEIKIVFNGWWKLLFDAVSVPVHQLANRLADLIVLFKEAYDGADATVKNDVRSVWPEAYNLLESDFADNFAEAARKFVKAGYNADIRTLSANADYPPKAPKVKINYRQGDDFY
ncbi:unnamed protein product [Nippostrongylus brasiliensis]|uniref:Secreted protein n=1 Tax=Nippostrongylus brasiliensis TaxID=27835 RepID=A0A0N4YJH8_NIPBR|nr:unnamed protein product [Nippostrongylus brasiliensis]